MMGVDSHGKWGEPKQALKWEVVPDQPVCWETQILNLTTTFLPDWQLPLIFVRFISNLLSMYSNSVDFEANQTKIYGGCQSGRIVEPHNSKSDLPLNIHDKKMHTFFSPFI